MDILSNEINTSKSYMCKMFEKHTGTTIKKYILARRIAEAKRLLKMDENITSKTGMSPLKYANRYKKNIR